MTEKMLEIKDLKVAYGGIYALKGINLTVAKGTIVALLGANGAGKTTTLKTISSMTTIKEGYIKYRNKTLNSLSPARINRLGIVHSPEGRQIFADLTVLENLRLGAFNIGDKKKTATNFERVYHYFPILAQRQKQIAGTLSGGEQQMLAIARALMAAPTLLMLDEPSLGLAPLIVESIFKIVKEINAEGTTVLLVEQNALQTLRIADYAYVLEVGRISMAGNAADLITDQSLIAAYLGGKQKLET